MEPITLFSWGYWGWGNATPQLIEAVDAVEAARGFEPPLFIDVRISRSVRAPGFRDHAFENLLGLRRYTWLRDLGNKQIEMRTGPPLQIARPAAAHDLVRIAREAAMERRRVLFFCSCERPINDEGIACHRTEVARLVREAAKADGVFVRTMEWPGSQPSEIEVEVSPAVLRAVARGRRSIPLRNPVQLGLLAGLGWGSTARLIDGQTELTAVVGPANFSLGTWQLPVLQAFTGPTISGRTPRAWGTWFRETHGYEPQGAAERVPGDIQLSPNPPVRTALLPACVYTIAHIEKLRALAASGGSGTLAEGRQWVSARKLLEDARHSGASLPVIFASSIDCAQLIFWAVLSRIETDAKGTRYSFEHLRPIPGRRKTQELVLLNSGKNIAPGFIRPYALCSTPSFLLT